jgi:hypothetical protein
LDLIPPLGARAVCGSTPAAPVHLVEFAQKMKDGRSDSFDAKVGFSLCAMIGHLPKNRDARHTKHIYIIFQALSIS